MVVFFVNRPFCSTNSGDPDQMHHCAASHLGLCCLPIYIAHKKDIRLIGNKRIKSRLRVGQSEIQSKKGAYYSTDNMKLYKLHDAWILKRQIVKYILYVVPYPEMVCECIKSDICFDLVSDEMYGPFACYSY